MVVSVGGVQLEEGSHLEEGAANVHQVETLPQLLVDVDDLAYVAEDGDDDVVGKDLVLAQGTFKSLQILYPSSDHVTIL